MSFNYVLQVTGWTNGRQNLGGPCSGRGNLSLAGETEVTEEDVFPVEPAPSHCPIHDPVVAHSHRRSAKDAPLSNNCRRLHRLFAKLHRLFAKLHRLFAMLHRLLAKLHRLFTTLTIPVSSYPSTLDDGGRHLDLNGYELCIAFMLDNMWTD